MSKKTDKPKSGHFAIDIEAGLLTEALQQVAPAMSGRTTLPILAAVHLIAFQPNDFRLSRTDMQKWIKRSVSDVIVVHAGECAVTANLLLQLASRLPPKEVLQLRAQANFSMQVTAGKRTYALAGYRPEEYPQTPQIAADAVCTEISEQTLQRLLTDAVCAASTEETRPIICTVLLTAPDVRSLRAVATDTHRLAVSEALVEEAEPFHVLLDTDSVAVLRKELAETAEPARLRVDPRQVQIALRNEEIVILFRQVEGQYPNWQRVMPSEFKTDFVVDREELIASLSRIRVVMDDDVKRIGVCVSGMTMRIFANSTVKGSQGEEEVIVSEFEGDDIEVYLNCRFLLDALRSFKTKNIRMRMTEPLRPCLLEPMGETGFNLRHVLMPMRSENAR